MAYTPLNTAITPVHYSVHIDPDLTVGDKNYVNTFTGSEVIGLNVSKEIDSLVLNVKE
jgi:hypothetical protein